jgi:hypothetical protein
MKTVDGRIWESIHVVYLLLTDFPEKSAASVYSLFDPQKKFGNSYQTTPHDILEDINLHSTAVKISNLT